MATLESILAKTAESIERLTDIVSEHSGFIGKLIDRIVALEERVKQLERAASKLS